MKVFFSSVECINLNVYCLSSSTFCEVLFKGGSQRLRSMSHLVFGPFDNKEDYSVHDSLFHVFWTSWTSHTKSWEITAILNLISAWINISAGMTSEPGRLICCWLLKGFPMGFVNLSQIKPVVNITELVFRVLTSHLQQSVDRDSRNDRKLWNREYSNHFAYMSNMAQHAHVQTTRPWNLL